MSFVVPAPKENTGPSQIMNFMLQMSSLSEQAKTRKLRQQQIDIDREALGPKNALNLAQANNMDIVTAQKIAEYKEFTSKDSVNLRREQRVLRAAGIKDAAQAAKAKRQENEIRIAQLDKMSPAKQRLMVFADEIAKTSRAEIQGLATQNDAANQTIKLMTLEQQYKISALNQQMQGIATMESPNDRVAMAQAIQAGDQEGIKLAAAGEIAYRDAERAKGAGEKLTQKQTTPVTQSTIKSDIDNRTEYSPDAMAQLRIAQDTGGVAPELRKIKVKENVGFGTTGPYGWIGPKEFQVMTEQEARSRGFGAQWDAQSPPEDTKTPVKDNVRAAVKKTTGTKKTSGTKKVPDAKTVTDDRGFIKMIPKGSTDPNDVVWTAPEDVDFAKQHGYVPSK